MDGYALSTGRRHRTMVKVITRYIKVCTLFAIAAITDDLVFLFTTTMSTLAGQEACWAWDLASWWRRCERISRAYSESWKLDSHSSRASQDFTNRWTSITPSSLVVFCTAYNLSRRMDFLTCNTVFVLLASTLGPTRGRQTSVATRRGNYVASRVPRSGRSFAFRRCN